MSGLIGSAEGGASVDTARGPDDDTAAGGGAPTAVQLGLDWFGMMKFIFAQKTQLRPLQWQAETSRGESEDFNAADGDWINDTTTSGAGAVGVPSTAGSVLKLLGPNVGTAGFARWYPGAGAATADRAPLIAKFTGMVESGEGSIFGYLADPGQGLANLNPPEPAPQLYPTDARTFATMRVTATGGGMTTNYTVTLYKNGVATAQQVTVPAGTVAGTVIADFAHPISFAANDKFDVRWDNSAGGSFKAVAVVLEGPSGTQISDQLWSWRQRRWMMAFRLGLATGVGNGNPFVAGVASFPGGVLTHRLGLGSPALVANANWHVTLDDVNIFDTGVPVQAGATGNNYLVNFYLACFDFEHLVCNFAPGVGADQVAAAMTIVADAGARPFAGIESAGANLAHQGLYIDKAIMVKEL